MPTQRLLCPAEVAICDTCLQGGHTGPVPIKGPRAQEPIQVYHAMLHKLWIDADSQEEEPWCTEPNVPLPPGAQLEDPLGH